MAAVITDPASSSRNVIQPTGDFVALTLRANASQTVDLEQWQDSSGTVLANVAANGFFKINPTSALTTNPTPALFVTPTFTGLAGTLLGLRSVSNAAPSANSGAQYIGTDGRAVTSGGFDFTSQVKGGSFLADHEGTGLIATAIGFQAQVISGAGGSITNAYGGSFTINNGNAGGTIGLGIGVRVELPGATGAIADCRGVYIRNQGSANITTATALLIDNQTGAGTNIAMKIGTGNLGFNGSTPVAKQTGASAAGIAAIVDANARAAIGALQTALANYGFVTSPA